MLLVYFYLIYVRLASFAALTAVLVIFHMVLVANILTTNWILIFVVSKFDTKSEAIIIQQSSIHKVRFEATNEKEKKIYK